MKDLEEGLALDATARRLLDARGEDDYMRVGGSRRLHGYDPLRADRPWCMQTPPEEPVVFVTLAGPIATALRCQRCFP